LITDPLLCYSDFGMTSDRPIRRYRSRGVSALPVALAAPAGADVMGTGNATRVGNTNDAASFP
jgi:hypothetical protein